MTKIIPSAIMLRAYRAGVFPMSDDRNDPEIYWLRPIERGIFPMDNFHIPRSLKRFIKKTSLDVTINQDFDRVIEGCINAKRGTESKTWINKTIEASFKKLHQEGHAHSFETRTPDGAVVGGLYGLSIKGAFFGESMFSIVSNASKLALIMCYNHLKNRDFLLFDTQFTNAHIAQFGCQEIDHISYNKLLKNALEYDRMFI